MDINILFAKFFEVRDQIHYWHLQTKSYSEHKALNQFYDDWLELADQFIETFQGRYNPIAGQVNIKLASYGKQGDVQGYLKLVLLFLQGDARKVTYQIDTDLNNILDEMQGLTSQTIFLLNLK
jgi:Family of unknown function (DUF5856)